MTPASRIQIKISEMEDKIIQVTTKYTRSSSSTFSPFFQQTRKKMFPSNQTRNTPIPVESSFSRINNLWKRFLVCKRDNQMERNSPKSTPTLFVQTYSLDCSCIQALSLGFPFCICIGMESGNVLCFDSIFLQFFLFVN